MRPGLSLSAAVATLLILTIGSVGTAAGQAGTEESYWGEHTLNGFARAWPALAIAVLAAPMVGAMLGVFELGASSMLFLLAAIAFIAYHFYWQPRAADTPQQVPRSHNPGHQFVPWWLVGS